MLDVKRRKNDCSEIPYTNSEMARHPRPMGGNLWWMAMDAPVVPHCNLSARTVASATRFQTPVAQMEGSWVPASVTKEGVGQATVVLGDSGDPRDGEMTGSGAPASVSDGVLVALQYRIASSTFSSQTQWPVAAGRQGFWPTWVDPSYRSRPKSYRSLP